MADPLRIYAQDAAHRAGIDGPTFERQIQQESGFDPDAHNPSGADGIAQIVPRFHPGVNTRDPRESLDYAARLMAGYIRAFGDYRHALAAYNWGSGHVGGGTWDGEHHEPWNGQRETLPGETQRYLDIILGPGWPEPGAAPMPTTPTYDPTTPVVTQNHDWDCAEQSTLWAMTAYGRHPSDAWMEASMLTSGVESTELGLLVGDGSQLAAWITEQYGEFGYRAYNAASVSFDDVRSVAGASPVMIGGHRWGSAGHWSGVRRYDAATDTLMLANPGGNGPIYGQTSLDRQQFAERAPWSMVVVTHESQTAPTPVPPPPPPVDELAALRAENERLRTVIGYASHDISAAIDKETTAIRASLGALDAATSTLKGQS